MVKGSLLIVISIVLITVGGCITFPQVHPVRNSRTYQVPYNQVWNYMVSFFDVHNIPIEKMDKSDGIIHAEMSTFANSMADCGKQALSNNVSRHAKIKVLVKSVQEGTQVTVTTYFSEIRNFVGAREKVHCNSYGVLESEVLHAVPSARSS